MGALFVRLLIPLALLSNVFAVTAVTPTTTLTAETSNNTSAADAFLSQSNGNLGAGNVSKQPIRSLLYPGATTKVFAHLMGWFGGSNHMDVGYASDDSAQVHRQVRDMVSRGIDGVIIDWYGNTPNIRSDNVTKLIKQEAEATPGFSFMVSVDKGALKYCTTGCDPTNELIKQLNYVASTYFSSPAYARINGRPAVTNFDLDKNYSIDWTKVAAGVSGNPVFIFQHSSGLTHAYSAGSYSWVMPNSTNPDDWAQAYLQNFYKNALANPTKYAIGSTYPGFDDTLAAWSMNRIMNQNCGQTWLNTFAQINSQYSAANQLDAIQLNTWNDYEEGTEIESGIENCVSVNAGISGDVLTWGLSGNPNTVDHYTIFISADGENLMPLGDYPVSTNSLRLSSFGFAAGTYKIYVKAVGKAAMANKVSSPASYSVLSTTTTQLAAVLSITPYSGKAPLDVTASASTSDTSRRVVSSSIDFGDGTVASGTAATHTYRKAGTFTVRATIVDSTGASVSTTKTVNVQRSKKLTVSSTSNLTLQAGQVGQVELELESGDAPTSVRLRCEGLPVGASCIFRSDIVELASNTRSSDKVTVTTSPKQVARFGGPLSILVASICFPLIGLVTSSGRRTAVAMCLICALVLSLAGCGAATLNNQTAEASKRGTPSGVYKVVIVADGATEQATSHFNLLVQ